MGKRLKGENTADAFLILSQIAFFTAIIINYTTNAFFSEKIFIWVAGFLLGMTIITSIIKLVLKYS